MSNRSAVDAISERVAEVISLAEQLDEVLTSYHHSELSHGKFSREFDSSPSPERISPPPILTSQQEWFRDKDDTCRSEEDFQTASECTCTPPSRSSSYYTASDGGSPWWSVTQNPQVVEGEVIQEIKETKTIKLSPEGCSIVTEKTCSEHQRDRTNSAGAESPSSFEREQSIRILNGTPEPWRVFDVDVEPWGRRTPRSDGLRVLEVEEWAKSQEGWRESEGTSWEATGGSSGSDRDERGGAEESWRKLEIRSSNEEAPSSNDDVLSSNDERLDSKDVRIDLPSKKQVGAETPLSAGRPEAVPSTSTADTIRQASDSSKSVNKRTLAGMLEFLPSAILKHNLTNIQGKIHMS